MKITAKRGKRSYGVRTKLIWIEYENREERAWKKEN